MRNNKGFTLIELLVTIALVLSVLAIAVISIISISKRKKEEAYETVKEQIIDAAEQYIDSNEYLFEGLEENSVGIITVGTLVKGDYLNKVTDPRSGESINECSQVQVSKKNGIYNSEFKEYDKNDKCDSNYSITISELGAPGIDLSFYKQGNINKSIVSDSNGWFNINKLGEKGKLGVKVQGKTQGNGQIVGISVCSQDGNVACTNYKNYVTNDSSYNDNNTFNTDTKGKSVCYKVTNLSGKSAIKCTYAKVDTEKPTCNLSVSGTAKKENNATKINYTGWYTSKVDVLIDNMSNDVKMWSWKSDSWKSEEYDYKKTKPSDLENLYISADGKNRSVSVNMEDDAGNKNAITYQNINIDKTAPKCNVTLEGDRKNKNQSYWYTSNVTLKGECSDASSGCNQGVVSNTFSNEGKYSNAVAGTVSDKAGNTNTCTYGTNFGIDKTPPATINVSNPYVCQEKDINDLKKILENFNSKYKDCDKYFKYNNGTFDKKVANFYLYMEFASSDEMSGLENNKSSNYNPNEGWKVSFELFDKNGKKVTGCLQENYPCTWQQEAKVCDRAGNCTKSNHNYNGLSY